MHRWSHVVVAAAVLAASGPAHSAGQDAAAVQRPESQQEYWAQVDRKDWSAAVTAAEKLVAAARDHQPAQPLALAEALTMLGNAQFSVQDYTGAEQTFSESLKLVEQHTGGASPKLLDPLRGLGYTLAASGRHEEAIPPLERAILISRRSYGLFDLGQQPVLKQLATSLTRVGQFTEAERHIAYLVEIAQRTYGRRDTRQVPTLCVAGDWYASVGNFVAARGLYRAAIDLIEKKLGRDDVALVQPLRSLAQTYLQELQYSILGVKMIVRERMPTDANGASNDSKPLNPRYLNPDGEKALERAVRILEMHEQRPRDAYVAALIDLGDWHQIKSQPDKALPIYTRAAQANAQPASDGAPAPLTFPVRVYYPSPPQALRNQSLPADQVDETFVEVQFTVTPSGEVQDAKVTDQNATSRQASETLQAVRGARFRPKFVNGAPVETTGMTLREVFRTRKQTEADKTERRASS